MFKKNCETSIFFLRIFPIYPATSVLILIEWKLKEEVTQSEFEIEEIKIIS